MTVCHVTLSKVKVMEVRKLRKWLISKAISSAAMHVMVNFTFGVFQKNLLHVFVYIKN